MKTRIPITSITLKIIAMISMLLDHMAAIPLKNYLVAHQMFAKEQVGYQIYYVLRAVPGRIAFPIFCFLLVEGFIYTKSRRNYAGRLLLFALISEPVFDLAFYKSPKFWENKSALLHSNPFFTLLLALLMLISLEAVQKWLKDPKRRKFSSEYIQTWVTLLLAAACFGIFGGLSELLHSEYGIKGVLAILLLYLFRRNRQEQVLVGAAAFIWEPWAILSMIPIYFYNGKKGKGWRYFFYLFYPGHLLILYLISRMLLSVNL